MHEAEEAQFAERVSELRQAKGWSQSELARRMVDAGWKNFTQMTVSRTEKGERPIRLSEARGLASVLGSSVGMMILPPEDATNIEKLASAVSEIRRARRRIYSDLWNLEAARQEAAHALQEHSRSRSEFTDPALVELAERFVKELEDHAYADFMDIVKDAEGVFWNEYHSGWAPDGDDQEAE